MTGKRWAIRGFYAAAVIIGLVLGNALFEAVAY